MKTIVLTLTIIIISVTSYSQSLSTDVKTSDYYLTKSRHQKTAAWIMLGGGVVLTGLGFAAEQAEIADYALGDSNSGNAGSVLAVVGIGSALGSIPFFISAAHNRQKAAEVTFNMQRTPKLAAVANRTTVFQPALTLKVYLR